ncbi:MAG: hypothetical protein OHK93_001341 [Ramalina farinacea]|uniref:DUF7357 domain-containing protein n=1 Tax=Ramalina farinacea TaxID=258253 RepID=A0AA43TSS3_9LECA|nr:hypothetical protein [Ramalina farinacea]
MRLRLTVQRQGLPSTFVLWDVRQSSGPQGPGLTISQFLDQVNDVIPLEGGDWGLEDYALEVGGFECLHFTELRNILKEDDEVCIRPLQTTDLRVRTISGRHQISEDGKHLIDGVAFGRPFLRKASRPAVRIPPRKRPRITYDEDNDDEIEDARSGREVVVRADFENADGTGSSQGEEEDEDDDFEPEDEDALTDELRDLEEDQFRSDDASQAAAGTGRSSRRHALRPRHPQGLGLLEYFDKDGEALLSPYENPLLDKHYDDDPQQSRLPPKERKRRQPPGDQFPKPDMKGNLRDSSTSPEPAERRSSAGSNKSVRFKDTQEDTPVTILASESSDSDSDDEDDDDFQPDGSLTSDKENEPPTDDIEDDLETTKSSDSSSASWSDGDSASSSDSEQDDGNSGISSDEISDSSSSASSPDPDTNTKTMGNGASLSVVPAPGVPTSLSGECDDATKELQSPQKDAVSPDTPVDDHRLPPPRISQPMNPPHSGKRKTQQRNARRSKLKRRIRLINQGILPAGITPSEAQKYIDDNRIEDKGLSATAAPSDDGPGDRDMGDSVSIASTQGNPPQAPQNETAQQGAVDLEGSSTTIRENLGPLSTNDGPTPDTAPSKDASSSSPQTPSVQVEDSLQQSLDPETAVESAEGHPNGGMPKEQTSPSQPRRARLDVESSSRLLFGALGLKAPKTPEDASALQAKLMRDTKPAFKPQVDGVDDASALAADEGTTSVTDDLHAKNPVVGGDASAIEDESWREKINLMAVECCYDDITLSEPPFPFVQRWDPQQQYGYGTDRVKKSKKNKNKKRKRNDRMYYETQDDDGYFDEHSNHSQNKTPRWEDYEAPTAEAKFRKNEPSMNRQSIPYDNDQYAQAVSNQLMRETMDSAEAAQEPLVFEDLPPFRAVIAFKKFEMSVEHGWQPYISAHRTARVDGLQEDGSVEMTWAKRDQPKSRKQYDEATGERILENFEMPGFEEDDEDEDPSKTVVMFSELIEPVLIRSAEDEETTGVAQKAEHMSGLSSDKHNEEQELQDAQAQAVEGKRPLPSLETTTAVSDVQVRSSQPIEEASEDGDKQETPSATLRGDIDFRAIEKSNTVIAAERLLDRINGKTNASTEIKANHINIPFEKQPSSPARHEISQVMRDAGWRSSIDDDLKRQMEMHRSASPTPTPPEHNKSTLNDIPSPKFHGFYSPPSNRYDEARSQSPTPNGLQHSNEQVSESRHSDMDGDEAPLSSATKTDKSIHYPSLPQLEDSSEIYPDQRQHRSSSLYNDHSETTPQPISPPSLRRLTDHAKSPTPTPTPLSSFKDQKKDDKASNPLNGTANDSDSDELPPLFSQAFENRMSQELDIKSEPSSNNPSPAPKRKPKAAAAAAAAWASRNKANHPNGGTGISQQRSSTRTWSSLDNDSVDSGNYAVSQIQSSQFLPPTQTQQSQIVDLTLTSSSDPLVEFDDTFEDGDESWRPSSSLPAGSGWIGKKSSSTRRGKWKDEMDGDEDSWVREPGSMRSSAPPVRSSVGAKARRARRRGVGG